MYYTIKTMNRIPKKSRILEIKVSLIPQHQSRGGGGGGGIWDFGTCVCVSTI